MKTKFALFLLILVFLSCRKDELIITEYIDVKVENDDELSMQVQNPKLILDGNALKFVGEDSTLIEIDLGINKPKTGFNQPVRVTLPFGFCDDKTLPCKANVTMEISSFSQVNEIVQGELKGKVFIDNKLQDIVISFNVTLIDQYQKIKGQIWFDINKNNLLDSDENGINGFKIKSQVNGETIDSKSTDRKPYSKTIDGYFELKTSTTFYNDIIIDLPPLDLVFVEKNAGSDPLLNSHFDADGKIIGLDVNLGDNIVINAGLKAH